MEQIFRVPAGYQARSLAGAIPSAKTPQLPPRPTTVAGLPAAMFAAPAVASRAFTPEQIQRPALLVPEPTPDFPTMTGELPPDVDDPFEQYGLIENVSIRRQAIRRMQDEAKRINERLSQAVDKNGGQALTIKRKGEIIRDGFKGKEKPPTPEREKARGMTDEALAAAQRMFAFDGDPFVDNGVELLLGRWGDISCGGEPRQLEAVVQAALEPGREATLAMLWDVNPEHVGIVAAAAKGAFR